MQIDLTNSIRNNLLDFLKGKDEDFVREAKENQLSLNEILSKYQFYLKRHIPLGKRSVKISSLLKCPNKLQSYFEEFQHKVEDGDDLNPYLSKTTSYLDAEDQLLSYWKIHHFHLGELKDNESYSKRSGPLLFVRFYKKTAFFIDIKEHGSWYDISLLKILCKEFPESMTSYKLKGVTDLYGTSESLITEDAIKTLRKSNANTLIKIDNDIYITPSVTANGTDLESLVFADKLCGFVKLLEQAIIADGSWIREKFFWIKNIVVDTDFYDDRFAFIINIKIADVVLAKINFADGLYSINCGKYRFNNKKI